MRVSVCGARLGVHRHPRAKRRSQGLCLDCAAPVAIEVSGRPRARCPTHLLRAARWQLEARGGVRNPDRLTRAASSRGGVSLVASGSDCGTVSRIKAMSYLGHNPTCKRHSWR